MIEAGVLVTNGEAVYWHTPENRTGGSLPDSLLLWQMFWHHRKTNDLGFAHSHPGSGVPGPSMEDLTTFAAVEVGLGRRIKWWITSADRVIQLEWAGPNKLDYKEQLILDPLWVETLRKISEIPKEKSNATA